MDTIISTAIIIVAITIITVAINVVVVVVVVVLVSEEGDMLEWVQIASVVVGSIIGFMLFFFLVFCVLKTSKGTKHRESRVGPIKLKLSPYRA